MSGKASDFLRPKGEQGACFVCAATKHSFVRGKQKYNDIAIFRSVLATKPDLEKQRDSVLTHNAPVIKTAAMYP